MVQVLSSWGTSGKDFRCSGRPNEKDFRRNGSASRKHARQGTVGKKSGKFSKRFGADRKELVVWCAAVTEAKGTSLPMCKDR